MLKKTEFEGSFWFEQQLLYCPWGLIIRLPTFSNIYRFIYVVRFRTYWNIMSWSEVWRNSSIFINTHYADFKSMLLMQIFRGGKCPVISVNHQCHWVIASLPYRESPVCGYTWVVKTHPLSFPTTWATSILFPNDLGDEREGINKQTNKQTKKRWCSCCCSVTKSCFLFVTPWTAAHQASLFFSIFQSLLKFMSNKSVVLSNHLILYCPLLRLHSVICSIWIFSQMSQFFPSVGQSIGALASASIFPINIQCWFRLGLTGLISLPSKGLSRVFSSTTIWKLKLFRT